MNKVMLAIGVLENRLKLREKPPFCFAFTEEFLNDQIESVLTEADFQLVKEHFTKKGFNVTIVDKSPSKDIILEKFF